MNKKALISICVIVTVLATFIVITTVILAGRMDEARINDFVARMELGELTLEEFRALDLETANRIMRRRAELFPPSDEQREIWRIQDQEWMRANLDYLVQGNFVTASNDTNLQTIERFAFVSGSSHGGSGLAIDVTHGMVYYDPRAGSYGLSVLHLDSNPFYVDFINADLERLIQAIIEAGLHDWDEYIQGDFDTDTTNWGGSWAVGIKFSDDTILRRGGSGATNSIPPQHQWDIFINFINTLGEEIIERHAAEVALTDE